jgi:hypothetical protein
LAELEVEMKRNSGVSTSLLVLTLWTGIGNASVPTAVYALVDKIVVEPNSDKPERVQVFGLFALAKGDDSFAYQAPQRGFLYLKLPKEKLDLALKEWSDLKEVAGTRQVVAFGDRYSMKVRVRKNDERPDTPEEYVVGFGVVKIRSNSEYPPVKALREYSGH